MITPQPGVLAQGTRSHMQLEFVLKKGARMADVRAALNGFREPAVTFGGANVVVGFGPALWRRLAPQSTPESLAPFRGVKGKKHRAPATQRDLWVWIHGHGHDIALDVARGATHALSGVADLALEVTSFVYRDSRDLLGFIDGTENPPVADAPEVALFPPDAPGAGGSIAICMKFVHDITKFQALPLPEQEGAIGRTRLDSQELADDVRPETSHISRVVIEEDGEELEIFRRSTPYGGVAEHGLYFIAFTNAPHRIDKMLARMYGTADGVSDRLLDFSRAVTGSYFFIPSIEDLARVAEPPRSS